ncbi:hypothetical protein CAPTEDRAFT_34995, partial [Capitella teleta]
CINTRGSYTCDCDEGYELHPNGKSCIDINECLGERGTNYNVDCHNCINTRGSYTCDCDEGYELHPDRKSCIECDVDNGGCQHQCNENDMDKWCSCDEGF